MAKLKTYWVHCTGGKNQPLKVEVDAINPPQAVEFGRARFPGYKNYYVSSEKR